MDGHERPLVQAYWYEVGGEAQLVPLLVAAVFTTTPPIPIWFLEPVGFSGSEAEFQRIHAAVRGRAVMTVRGCLVLLRRVFRHPHDRSRAICWRHLTLYSRVATRASLSTRSSAAAL